MQTKLGLNEFLISTDQIDGISEYIDVKRQTEFPIFVISIYKRQNQHIPVINLKKYLNCEDQSFIKTSQTRILFFHNPRNKTTIGVVFDEIVGYNEVRSEDIKKERISRIPDALKCFQIEFQIKLNDKFIHLLDLNKLIDEVTREKLVRHL